MSTHEILNVLATDFPEVLKADGFDDAILGVTDGWFVNGSHHAVVCYDYNTCQRILILQGLSEDEADEYLQFNTLGAYMGEYTPVFLYNWRQEGQ